MKQINFSKYVRAIGMALKAPVGKREFAHWVARGWWWDFHQFLDARPAYDLFQAGVSLEEAIRVYRMAMENRLWHRGYGSPYSPHARVVLEGVRRRWPADVIRQVGECYSTRLPKDAVWHAKLRLRLRGGFFRLRGESLPAQAERLALRALCRLSPGRHSYLAVLGALCESVLTGEDSPRYEPEIFWEELRQQLAKPTSVLIDQYGSVRMKWCRLGVEVHHRTTVPPPPGASGRVVKALFERMYLDGGVGENPWDDHLRPVRNLLVAFGKQAVEMVDLLGVSVHNAGQFTPPEDLEVARAAGEFVLSHRKALKDRLRQDKVGAVRELFTLLSNYDPATMAGLSWSEAVKACRRQSYGPELPPVVAEVAAELALSTERAMEYVRWLEANRRTEPSTLPHVEVRGEEVGLKGGWSFRKLADDDCRGPLLGLYTNCCQHPQGAGASCAAHGWTSPLGGFYVVEADGRIVAQSWAWRTNDTVVMDSVESLAPAYLESAMALYREGALRILAADPKLQAVHVGDIPDWTEAGSLPAAAAVFPLDYGGYRDSKRQWVLARREDLHSSTTLTVEEIKEIEREAYPPHMREMGDVRNLADIAEYADCRAEELIVLGKPRRWYLIAAVRGEEAEVVDLAKRPGTGAVPWRSFVRLARARAIKRVRFDARRATSYPLILALAPRLGMEILRQEPWSWEGEDMVEMEIRLHPA
jgi:hypothetical protein